MLSNHPSFKTYSDLELLAHYALTDDKICVGILFERHSAMVYAVCLKYFHDKDESKDAAMQVFEKLMVDLKKHSINNFKSWLHSVAKNHCLMQLRKNKGIKEIGGINAEQLTPIMEYHEYLHQEEANLKELKLNELENALFYLSDEQKTCIELFYLKEKSYIEVSDLTGFSINNVKSYIQNGKRNLKNIIIKNNVTQK